jgi:cytochrome c peroxidase
VPDANPLTPDKVALGRQLFFETKLSSDHMVSCATCHDPNKAFADGRAVARGVNGMTGARNTPSLINAGSGQVFFWDGRAGSLEAQVLGPIFNPKEMGLTEAALQRQTGLSSAEVADALASYVRTIRSGSSRYDWYLAGQTQVLTSIERVGLDLFQGKGRCGRCHRGSNFTDDRFHNTGVGWQKGKFVDEGRFAVTGDPSDRGAFKTPTLREIARTAPYMHDGSIATLEDVVEFYSQGGRENPELDPRMRPIRFTTEEKQALVAFLKTLSGQVSEGF